MNHRKKGDMWVTVALLCVLFMAVLPDLARAKEKLAAPEPAKPQLVAVYIYKVCGEVRAIQGIEVLKAYVFIRGYTKELDASVAELVRLARTPGFGVSVGEIELQPGCTRI